MNQPEEVAQVDVLEVHGNRLARVLHLATRGRRGCALWCHGGDGGSSIACLLHRLLCSSLLRRLVRRTAWLRLVRERSERGSFCQFPGEVELGRSQVQKSCAMNGAAGGGAAIMKRRLRHFGCCRERGSGRHYLRILGVERNHERIAFMRNLIWGIRRE